MKTKLYQSNNKILVVFEASNDAVASKRSICSKNHDYNIIYKRVFRVTVKIRSYLYFGV